MEIPPEVAESLGFYVYLYIDPRNGQIKYVGKGSGHRATAHLEDTNETAKTKWIKDLNSAGQQPRIDILARGLTEHEALIVERSAIDAIGIPPLTNAVRGHDTEHGREPLQEIIIREAAEEAVIQHPVLLFQLNQTFNENMAKEEIYEMTRGTWVVGLERRQKAQYAFGVSAGIVRGVFSVDAWHRGGSTKYRFRPDIQYDKDGHRWEFTSAGDPPQEILDMYLYKSVRNFFKKGNRNPVRFIAG